MDEITTYAQAHPDIALVMAAIMAQAAIASRIIDFAKSLLRQYGRDIGPEPARGLCILLSVGGAVATLGAGSYPWPVWVLGGLLAIATGPWFHAATKAGQEATG
jgi:hypothetical protein